MVLNNLAGGGPFHEPLTPCHQPYNSLPDLYELSQALGSSYSCGGMGFCITAGT